MNERRRKFLDDQRDYFTEPDERKFHWMTSNPHFSKTERALLPRIEALRPERLLEVGSGEGGNLVNLQSLPPFTVGADLFPERSRFAKKHCPSAHFVAADGLRLPFADEAFDLVFCRDLLHHVLDKAALVAEMRRVCRAGGHLVCIEACGKNPVIFCLAAAVRAERGLLRSTGRSVRRLLDEAGLENTQVEMHQPLPIYRILLHPVYGRPKLGGREWYRRWNDRLDRLFARLVPRRWWGYAVISGRKPA